MNVKKVGTDIVFQFILSSKESHTNFYVYDHIIKLDGPLWVPYWPHKQNQQDGKRIGKFLCFSGAFEGGGRATEQSREKFY